MAHTSQGTLLRSILAHHDYLLPPLHGSLHVFLDGGSVLAISNITLAAMLMFSIADWKGFIVMTAIGLLAAWGLHHVIQGPIHLQLTVASTYLLVYGVLFSILIGGLFVRKTAKYNAGKLRRTVVTADSAGHEIKNKGSIMAQTGELFELYLQHNVSDVKQDGKSGKSLFLPDKAYETLLQSSTALRRSAQQLKNTVNTFNATLREQYSTTKVQQSLRTIIQQAIALIQDEDEVDIQAHPPTYVIHTQASLGLPR